MKLKFQRILVISEMENIPKQSHLSVSNTFSNLIRGLKYKAGTRLFSDCPGCDNIKINIKIYELDLMSLYLPKS